MISKLSEPAKKKKKALFPKVFIHSLGKGHEPLPKLLYWPLKVPRQHCWWFVTARASAAGVRACFYPNRVLVLQALHMVINCISVRGAHSTPALMLSYQLPRTALHTTRTQLPVESLHQKFGKQSDRKKKIN